MACYAESVIKIAEAENGYIEKETKSDLDSKTANAGDENLTKYARDLDAVTDFYNGRKQGCSWCDIFVDWCFYKAFGKTKARKLLCQPTKSCGAGCQYSMEYYQKKKQFFTEPRYGDQIFFFNSDGIKAGHTGLVRKVTASYVYTIEGNTSTTSGVVANGGLVAMKKYARSNKRIAGYGRPAYDDLYEPTKTTTTESADSYQCIHTVAKGDTLWKIANKYLGKGARYKEIKELNGLKTDNIKPGKKLKIPMK